MSSCGLLLRELEVKNPVYCVFLVQSRGHLSSCVNKYHPENAKKKETISQSTYQSFFSVTHTKCQYLSSNIHWTCILGTLYFGIFDTVTVLF